MAGPVPSTVPGWFTECLQESFEAKYTLTPADEETEVCGVKIYLVTQLVRIKDRIWTQTDQVQGQHFYLLC